MNKYMNFRKRTAVCGELRPENAGQIIVLNGWVDSTRDHGGVIFTNLRDRYGITQIVISPETQPELAARARELKAEYVIWAEGTVRMRENPNPKIPTGLVEISASDFGVINTAELLPFEISDEQLAGEELRLRYRYLDLRRPALQNNFIIRSKAYQIIHNYFAENGFLEFETPVLTKSTPEGARDYLVPSRIHKGKFYALPQSPQQYKQLLMVSGFDRYFQIVKCFRDEDLRADRQPEFTQIDVEMSFVSQEQVFSMVEGLMKLLFKEIWNVDLSLPLKRLSYEDAMLKYGSDKPDLRFEMELHTLNEVFQKSEFKVFRDVIDSDGIVCGIVAQNSAAFSRSQIDGLTNFVKNLGAKGLVWFKVQFNGIDSPTAKFLSEEEKRNLLTAMKAEPNDLILILAGEKKSTLNQMGALRLELAKRLELIKSETLPSLLWITDFPLFDWDEETKRFYAMHHPFTSPKIEEIDLLEKDPGKIKAQAYDLVLNGNEIAGGSIRIHNSELQSRMFRALGISDEEAKQKFGFLMNAFKYGAPPHGGIAFGFDRMVMLFAGVDSIRDTIAFPKTASAVSLMDECPSEVSEEQLRELHIKIVDK